ncbi:MAG: hypothetical protein HY000_34500 [Planctomycetes bacterium]|nr:hypothetical protein [Planctomycetota bacterium]
MNVDAMSGDSGGLWRHRAVGGASLGFPAGVKYGAIPGAICGIPPGIPPYYIGWIREPTVFGPGRPINPGATAEEERQLEKDYGAWQVEMIENDRWACVIWFVFPITLCVVLATLGASRRLGRRHPEWVKDVVNTHGGPSAT